MKGYSETFRSYCWIQSHYFSLSAKSADNNTTFHWVNKSGFQPGHYKFYIINYLLYIFTSLDFFKKKENADLKTYCSHIEANFVGDLLLKLFSSVLEMLFILSSSRNSIFILLTQWLHGLQNLQNCHQEHDLVLVVWSITCF